MVEWLRKLVSKSNRILYYRIPLWVLTLVLRTEAFQKRNVRYKLSQTYMSTEALFTIRTIS